MSTVEEELDQALIYTGWFRTKVIKPVFLWALDTWMFKFIYMWHCMMVFFASIRSGVYQDIKNKTDDEKQEITEDILAWGGMRLAIKMYRYGDPSALNEFKEAAQHG